MKPIFKRIILLLILLGSVFFVVSEFNEDSPLDLVKEADGAKIPGGTVLYLKPNSNWKSDGARFAAYFYGDGEYWYSMQPTGTDGYYYCIAKSGKNYTNVIFCRMNGGAADNTWNNKWNQTSDLVWGGSSNLYTVAEGTWDKGGGSWSDYNCLITFDANGGTLGDTSTTVKYGTAMTSSLTAPTKTGYTFNGYFDATSGGTKYYNSNMTSAKNWDKAKNTTLYAQWTPKNYTITFEENGGSTVTDITAGYTTTVIAPTAPTKKGYTFAGWYEKEDLSGIAYVFSTMPLNGKKLYAKWTANTYAVTLNLNYGGTPSTSTISVTYGSDMPEIQIPTRNDGYTFAGYYSVQTDGISSQQYYSLDGTSSQKWNIDNNTTVLYAYWVEPVYIYFELNYETFGIANGTPFSNAIKDYRYDDDTLRYLYAKQTSESNSIAVPSTTLIPLNINYVFKGWYDESGNQITEYTYSNVNKTYYAHWEKAANFVKADLIVDYYYKDVKDGEGNITYTPIILSTGINFYVDITDSCYQSSDNYTLTDGTNVKTSTIYNDLDSILLLNINDETIDYTATLTILNSSSVKIYEQSITFSVLTLTQDYLDNRKPSDVENEVYQKIITLQ